MPHRLIAPLLFDDLLDDRGNACRHHVVWKVFRHNTSRSDNAAAADGNPLEYGHVRAKPAVIANNNGQSPLETQVALFCPKGMRNGIEAAKRPNKHVVTKGNRTTVHKVAAMVHKAAVAKGCLVPVVKVGRRKDRQPRRKIGIEQGF